MGLPAGHAACQEVELGVGVKPAVPPPDPAVAGHVREGRAAVAGEEWGRKAARLAEAADAPRARTDASLADIERRDCPGPCGPGWAGRCG